METLSNSKFHTNKVLFITLFFLIARQSLFAFNLSVDLIPDSLKANANSVIRYDNTTVEITNRYEMTESYETAITVLNRFGNNHISLGSQYNKNRSIVRMEASVYDVSGKLIKKLKKKDLTDMSAVSSASIFTDDRWRFYNYTPVSYPYTIVFKLVCKGSNTAFIPQWNPVGHEYQSVLHSSYRLVYPAEWKLTLSERNFEGFNVVREEVPGLYAASVSSLPSVGYEVASPSVMQIFPSMRASLNHFRLEGLNGKADCWQEFGKWYSDNMLKGYDQIPEQTKLEVLDLVSGLEQDTVEMARRIFEYVQSRTRYVFVAIGIGGWKPMTVADVNKLGYGDCKALSFYTVSLLRMVGIPATYSIVYAGSGQRDIDASQICVQGNHVIVSIPLAETTYWLETTNQTTPFGYNGTFTDNRYVLSLSENDSRIEKTPEYPAEGNLQKTNAMINLFPDGSISAKIDIKTGGYRYGGKYGIQTLRKEDKEKYYQKDWNYLQGLRLNSIVHEDDKRSIQFGESVELEAFGYGTFSGDRMIIHACAFNRLQSVPPRYEKRKYPLSLIRAYKDEESYQISIPEGFTIESLPESIEVDSPFGYYNLVVELTEETQLNISRTFITRSGLFPPEEYENFHRFRRDISRFDQSKIVLIRK